MQKHKHYAISVRCRIVALMLLCWFLPLMLLAGINGYYLSSDQLGSRISKEVDRLKFSDEATIRQIEHVSRSSLQATYDGTLLDLYDDYLVHDLSQRQLLSRAGDYLRDNYARDPAISSVLLWYHRNPDRLYCNQHNPGVGATFTEITQYWNEDHDTIAALAATLGTRADFCLCGDRLYFVRNLCGADYQPVATLVLRLNTADNLKAYTTFAAGTSVTLHIDSCVLQISGDPVTAEETGLTEMGGRSGYRWQGGVLRLYHHRHLGDHRFTSLVRIEDSASFAPFRAYSLAALLTILSLIPLMALLLWGFHRHITRPIQELMEGAGEIEEGHLGYQLTEDPESTEFRYLADSFNTMSERLEYQFQHIYEEELALRDARIKALQSHINPHFMNNTLEIINWEARLSGNEKVSRMIEALATLMNAGIDRKMLPEIPLSEEMIYVNSYLYITSQRLGDRLTILNEFPEEIMDCFVPRLILQPVIENAIEHGVVRNGQGTVLLYGYREGEFLYLEIMNESVLTPEDEQRIRELLDPKHDTSREPSLNLGIANVNQRLRILYGEDSGLSVVQSDPRHVTSRLTIHLKERPGRS